MSITDLTIQAAWMVVLAIAALALAGWRKNASPTQRNLRRGARTARNCGPVGIAELVVPLYKRPNPLRRAWAAAASTSIGIIIGAVTAIVVAYGAAWIVIALTDLLKK